MSIRNEEIPMQFHPRAFSAFGADLVTNDNVAIAELVKNSYDAFAYDVIVSISDDTIEIIDDGLGMTADIIRDAWAVIATPYKKKAPTVERDGCSRRVSGNKGLGRFSAARLGRYLTIGSRGRMISEPDRSKAIELIDEAHASGARLSKACEELGITERTYFRWKDLHKEHGSYEDRRPHAEHPEPANKLSPEERQQVLDTVNDPKYASMPPCEIVPALADEGIYIASESTFYRVLREEKMQNHRGRAEEPQHRPISSHEANGIGKRSQWTLRWPKARQPLMPRHGKPFTASAASIHAAGCLPGEGKLIYLSLSSALRH